MGGWYEGYLHYALCNRKKSPCKGIHLQGGYLGSSKAPTLNVLCVCECVLGFPFNIGGLETPLILILISV